MRRTTQRARFAGKIAAAAASILLLATAGCPMLLGVNEDYETAPAMGQGDGSDGPAAPDAAPDGAADGSTDAPVTDAGGDASGDATADADAAIPTVYNNIADASSWSTFDTTTVEAGANGFLGGTFDGRFVYMAPFNNGAYDGISTRYDTTTAFGAAASWSTFNTATVAANARGFRAAAFDGRYVYLAPSGYVTPVVGRYDTLAAFDASASWDSHSLATYGAANHYHGAVFDGRFLYIVPLTTGTVIRYDTQGLFGGVLPWSTFDITTVTAGAIGFRGAIFDGRYLYFVPNNLGASGIAARYDTQAPFILATSWTTFDLTTANAGAKGFTGGAFDGRFVYFVPNGNVAPDGIVARYDTQAAFAAAPSWSFFDTATVNVLAKGFWGAAFDGRFLYFVPSNNGAIDGVLARYDTTAAFGTPASWSTFDMTTIHAGAKGFGGAVFDGRFVYFIPNNNGASDGIVLRFDAKFPPSMPAGYSGSFL